MLKNILIPEKIGNYFIFPSTILGFEIGKTHVSAIKINVSGKRQTVIEKYYEEFISVNNGTTYFDKVSNIIRKIIEKNKNYNSIKISFPSYLVIYKELTLPFTDISKIKTILDFEIEPILPFPIDEAIADFIVTKQDIKKKETTILVAVARKKDIQELIEPFKALGIQPSAIVVDIFGLYGILKASEISSKEDIALIDIESTYTNIAYLQEGQLKIVRSIQQGTSTIAKSISDRLKIEQNTALDQMNKFGLKSDENNEYSQAINESLKDLSSNIGFTLNSFKTLIPYFSDIKKIILVGRGTEIKGIQEFFSKQLNIDCQKLDINEIVQNKKFTIKEKNLPNSSLLSLSIAYPSEIVNDFNLLAKEFKASDKKLLMKQIIILISLFLLILISLFSFSYIQIKKLKTEAAAARSEVINTLKNRFEITDTAILRNLTEVINTANNKIKEEEAIWFSFSSRSKFSFLKYLQELSKIIDREAVGLNLKSLGISDGIITLEGEVKDFKALEILENELNESELFGHVSVPQETKFTIKITIKKNEENV